MIVPLHSASLAGTEIANGEVTIMTVIAMQYTVHNYTVSIVSSYMQVSW